MFEFEVHQKRSGLSVTMDPDLAKDVVMVLDVLIDLVRSVRIKAEAREADRKAKSERLRKKREREFDRRSLEIYGRYLLYYNASGDHKAARIAVKNDFHLELFADVDIYVTRGRQIAKKQARRDLRGAEKHILEREAA